MGPGVPFSIETPFGRVMLKPKVKTLGVIDKDKEVRRVVDNLIAFQIREINSDVVFSELFNASYFTNFDVHWQLLTLKLRKNRDRLKSLGKKAFVMPSLLEMDLKFIDLISIDNILKIREKELLAFEEFRLAMVKVCKEIESIPATEDFKGEVQKIVEEVINPELRKLDREFNRIRRYRLLRGAAISVGSVTVTVLAGGTPLTVLGAGLVGVLEEFAGYVSEMAKLKENAMYFLWKVKRSV